MCDNLLRFVDGHIFNQEANRSLALAHRGLRIMPKLTKAFRDLLNRRTLFCAHLMLIASVVLLFAGVGQLILV